MADHSWASITAGDGIEQSFSQTESSKAGRLEQTFVPQGVIARQEHNYKIFSVGALADIKDQKDKKHKNQSYSKHFYAALMNEFSSIILRGLSRE